MDIDIIDIDEILLDSINPEENIAGAGDFFPPLQDLSPPYFIMRKVVFDKELEYVLTEDGLPVYYYNGISFKNIGNMKADLDTILRARFLDMEISYMNKNNEEEDLDEPSNLIKFITISPDFIKELEETKWNL